ncbi:MAG: glycine zipper family protein [Candidatus Binataceae bacterium]
MMLQGRAMVSSASKRFSLQFTVAAFAIIFAAEANAQSNGLYVYPAKGQSQAQQDKDKYDCNSWAVSQTGFDPSRPPTTSSSSSPQTSSAQGQVVRGAARGAALGSVGGAIAGNAGTGAAAGAAMGALAGGMRRRAGQQQQAVQQQQQQANAQAASVNAYNRAMAACLQGRGYTVN